MHGPRPRRLRNKAFTLIELVVVLAIVGLLLSVAAPRYFHGIDKSKETVLRSNLAIARDALDKYYADHGRYPDHLAALVAGKYLRGLPFDPITESHETWTILAPDTPEKGGVRDIRSGAQGLGSNGTPYGEW